MVDNTMRENIVVVVDAGKASADLLKIKAQKDALGGTTTGKVVTSFVQTGVPPSIGLYGGAAGVGIGSIAGAGYVEKQKYLRQMVGGLPGGGISAPPQIPPTYLQQWAQGYAGRGGPIIAPPQPMTSGFPGAEIGMKAAPYNVAQLKSYNEELKSIQVTQARIAALPPYVKPELLKASNVQLEQSRNLWHQTTTGAQQFGGVLEGINKKFASNVIGQQLSGVQKSFIAGDLSAAKFREEVGKLQTQFTNLGLGGSKEFDRLSKSIQATGGNASFLHRTMERMGRTIIAFFGVTAIFGGAKLFYDAIKSGIQFNALLERAKLGIAAIFASQGEFTDATGRSVEGYTKLIAAQKLSGSIVKQLQKDNLETMATFEQLVTAYQQAAAFGLAKGYSPEQIRQYTVAMVQAGGAIGVQLDRMAEEVRSLMTGAIRPGQSLIAGVIGITSKDYQKYKGDASAWFKFIMDKLEAFRIAGVESQKTFSGIASNLKDAFQIGLGEGLSPFFDYLKKEMFGLQTDIVHWNEITKKMEVNPEFIKSWKNIGDTLISVTESLRGILKLGRDLSSPFVDLAVIIKDAFHPLVQLLDYLKKESELGKGDWATERKKRFTDLYKEYPKLMQYVDEFESALQKDPWTNFKEGMTSAKKGIKDVVGITREEEEAQKALNAQYWSSTNLLGRALQKRGELVPYTKEVFQERFKGMEESSKKQAVEIQKELSKIEVKKQELLGTDKKLTKEQEKQLDNLKIQEKIWVAKGVGILEQFEFKPKPKPAVIDEAKLKKEEDIINKLVQSTGALSKADEERVTKLLKSAGIQANINDLTLQEKSILAGIAYEKEQDMKDAYAVNALEMERIYNIKARQAVINSNLTTELNITKALMDQAEFIGKMTGDYSQYNELVAKTYDLEKSFVGPKKEVNDLTKNITEQTKEWNNLLNQTMRTNPYEKILTSIIQSSLELANMSGKLEEAHSIEKDLLNIEIMRSDEVQRLSTNYLVFFDLIKKMSTGNILPEDIMNLNSVQDAIEKMSVLVDQFIKGKQSVLGFKQATENLGEKSNIAQLDEELTKLTGSWEDIKNAEIKAIIARAEVEKQGKEAGGEEVKLIDQITAATIARIKAEKDLNFTELVGYGLRDKSLQLNQQLAYQYETLLPNAIGATTDALQTLLDDLQKGTKKPFVKMFENLRAEFNKLLTDIPKIKLQQIVVDVAKGGNLWDAILGKSKKPSEKTGGINEVKLEHGSIPVWVKNFEEKALSKETYDKGVWNIEKPWLGEEIPLAKDTYDKGVWDIEKPWSEDLMPEGETSDIWKTIKDGISSIGTWFSDMFKGLGIDFSSLTNILGDLGKGIADMAGAAIKFITSLFHQGGLITKSHQGGQSFQSKGTVGVPLAPDEVLKILKLKEFVVQDESVNKETLPFLKYINEYGKLPTKMYEGNLVDKKTISMNKFPKDSFSLTNEKNISNIGNINKFHEESSINKEIVSMNKFHEGNLINVENISNITKFYEEGSNKLKSNEIIKVLELGEFVNRKESVTSETKPTLDYINKYSKLPINKMHEGNLVDGKVISMNKFSKDSFSLDHRNKTIPLGVSLNKPNSILSEVYANNKFGKVTSVTVPITLNAEKEDKKLTSALREEIEEAVERVIRRFI